MQGAATGVGGEPGGQVVQLYPDRLRLRGGEFGFVVQEEEPGPCVEVGSDRGGQDPGGTELPGLRGQQPEAEPLDRFDAVLDPGVITEEGIEEPHRPEPGTPDSPWWAGMFVAMIW